ncbi:MAG: hypothetical protein NZ651_02630 [Candidatus Bipolaricaulota bacterium]|nr:hypothetical protein [Candidatus Bipolaricaulota bacterium]MDW8126652.1 hypothetical protein [Candidatus Bipolaricaulota bacterium]
MLWEVTGVIKQRMWVLVFLWVGILGLSGAAWAQVLPLTIWEIPTHNSLPHAIAVGADGKVYFTEFSGNKVGQLDPRTNELRERPVGAGPSGLVLNDDGGLFITLAIDNAIQFLVFTGGTASWAIPTANAWPEVLVFGTGPGKVNLWLNERQGRKVARFSPTQIFVTLPLITVPAVSVTPKTLNLEPVIQKVIPDVYPGNPLLPPPIALFPATASGPFTEWASFVTDRQVERVAVAPDGKVWFSQGEAPLCRLDPDTNTVLYYGLPIGSAGLALLVDPAGNVWFSDTKRVAIGRLDPTTCDISLWAIPEGREPFAILVSASGEVWFTDREGDTIGKLSPATGEFCLYQLPPGSHPLFLVLSADGMLWFTAERGNYLGRLAVKAEAQPSVGPTVVVPPQSFVVTGYTLSQSGNKAELTVSYVYDGTVSVPIWLGVEIIREGTVLSDFLVEPVQIVDIGAGKVSLVVTYHGTAICQSDAIRLAVFLASAGPRTTVKEIPFKTTWIP